MGNFFNREAFGDYTDTTFAMQIPLNGRFSHRLAFAVADQVTCIADFSTLVVGSIVIIVSKRKRLGNMTISD